MSIVISVRVGEGLVIAADSASTLLSHIEGENIASVAKVFNNATKLMQLKDYPIAVASWGAGNIGQRTIFSLVGEYANEQLKLKDIKKPKKGLSVKKHATDLMEFLVNFYNANTPGSENHQDRANIGVFVGGYSGSEFFPDEYTFFIPKKELKPLRQPENGKQNFGANWYGLTDAIVRLHHGYDNQLKVLLKDVGVEPKKISEVFKRMVKEVQYAVPFDGMPLQDAVDYAIYVVGVVVGRYRFTVGPELCGGPIEVAVITREKGFNWIHRKEILVRPFGPKIEEV